MVKILHKFERVVVLALLGMMMVTVALATVELAIILVQELLKPPVFLLNTKEMLEVLGFFLMVLIGLEVLETVKAYIEHNKVQAEIVILVALVAVSRKIIIVSYKDMTPELLLSMAALIIALAVAFFLVRRALTPAAK